MQAKTLQVGSQPIAYYESTGTGPAALLVHGNSASGLAFQKQIEGPLGAKFHLVALDLPGHGQSAPAADPQSTYTLPGYARIVVGVAKQLGLEHGVFVGWSLGGHIVLEASAQLPEAAGFMIFGTPPLGFPPAMAQAFLPHPAMGSAFKRDLSEEESTGYVTAFFRPDSAEVPEFFRTDCRATDGRARESVAASIGPGGYLDEIEVVGNLEKPLAILHGDQEQLVNLSYIDEVKTPTLWRGRVHVVSESGHAPFWENPESFDALLEAFLKETAK